MICKNKNMKIQIVKPLKELPASLTVEASIIVPIVTVIVFLIIYFNFYLHDRVKFESQIHMLALEGSNLIQYDISNDGSVNDYDHSIFYFFLDAKTEEKRFLSERITKTFDNGLFIGKLLNLSVDTNVSNLTYQGVFSYEIPLLGFFKIISLDTFEIPFEIKATIFPREETTRILDVALKTGESIKGVSKAIDKVVEVLNAIR